MTRERGKAEKVVWLFAATLFVSAGLLFSVQPMVGKMLLPLLGGSPAVWSTCMVFFQAVLLLGYLYAHLVTGRLGLGAQAILHAGVMLLPLLVLPIGVSSRAEATLLAGADPTYWLLGQLAAAVGLPFFVLAASAPLLQKWFTETGHSSAKDPYFLYGASNLGSLLALLGYPLVLERALRLSDHSRLWAWAYGALVPLVLLSAASAWRARRAAARAVEGAPAGETSTDASPVTWRDRARWVALALIPSSWLLGVTTHLSTDLAAAPLLWVVPLAIYLVTFILVFARRELVPRSWMQRLLPIGVLGVFMINVLRVVEPLWLTVTVHLAAFFLGAMVCHGALARSRPAPARLTEYFLLVSVGGVLGGLFNALLVPALFEAAGPIERPLAYAINRLEVFEYPLAMVAACLLGLPLRPALEAPSPRTAAGRGMGVVVALFVIAGLVWLRVDDRSADRLSVGFVFGLASLLCYTIAARPAAFAAGLGAMLVAMALCTGSPPLQIERSFFGVLRVTRHEDLHLLYHGSTLHGAQDQRPYQRREALSYYHQAGPVGQVFDAFRVSSAPPSVGIVGLGAGTIASYALPGEDWIYYEIDPAVARVANDRRYFSFLADIAEPPRLQVVLGDARLRLRSAADHAFGLLVIDAFSSDAIPVHLITREALALYLSKLAPGGVLAFHTSNRYLDLGPVLARLAADREPPLVARVREDGERVPGKSPSAWVAAARAEPDLGPIASDPRWKEIPFDPSARPWSDDYSDVIGAFRD